MQIRLNAAVIAICSLMPWQVAVSQQREYGSPADLKSITKIYIDTGDSVDLRNIMAEAIRKRIPQIQVLDGPEGAQADFVFAYEQYEEPPPRPHLAYSGTLNVTIKRGQIARLAATYRSKDQELDGLANALVKKFIKDYIASNSK